MSQPFVKHKSTKRGRGCQLFDLSKGFLGPGLAALGAALLGLLHQEVLGCLHDVLRRSGLYDQLCSHHNSCVQRMDRCMCGLPECSCFCVTSDMHT